jgi:CubicO group peptidase (beta-lactamase class C family)
MSNRISELMDRAVADGVFPGGSLLVFKDGAVAHRSFHGVTGGLNPVPVTRNTVYDVASLTKPLAMTASIMHRASGGRFDIEWSVSRHILEYKTGDKAGVRIWHLLSHRSGLPAWNRYYQLFPAENWSEPRTRQSIMRLAAKEPLEAAPGTRSLYSDIGFIVLDEFFELETGVALDRYFNESVARPLGAGSTLFLTSGKALPPGFFPAPVTDNVLGAVDDENCRAMGGVSGHAGLFSTTEDICTLMVEFEKGYYGKSDLFDRDVVRRFWTRPPGVPQGSHAMGWDTPLPEGASCGSRFSPSSVGHLGFTGCSVWYDPAARLGVILLSNRVCPSRLNEKIRTLRPLLHDEIYRVVVDRGI